MKAVIPAAGLGTRFLPYTKAQPKEMIPVVDKPAIQYVVEEAVQSGLVNILIVTGRGKRAISDHFDMSENLENHSARNGHAEALRDLMEIAAKAHIHYIRQAEPRGLGDAVAHAESFVDGQAFAVLLGDDLTMDPPCIGVLKKVHERLGGSVVALQNVPKAEIGRYGMAVGEETEPGIYRLMDLVEKPTPAEARSTLATIGRYIFGPSLFDHLRATLPGKGGEVQLTDAIRAQLAEEDVYGVLYAGRRYDVGDKARWLQATFELAMQREEFSDVLRDAASKLRPI